MRAIRIGDHTPQGYAHMNVTNVWTNTTSQLWLSCYSKSAAVLRLRYATSHVNIEYRFMYEHRSIACENQKSWTECLISRSSMNICSRKEFLLFQLDDTDQIRSKNCLLSNDKRLYLTHCQNSSLFFSAAWGWHEVNKTCNDRVEFFARSFSHWSITRVENWFAKTNDGYSCWWTNSLWIMSNKWIASWTDERIRSENSTSANQCVTHSTKWPILCLCKQMLSL